tara:strand:+ start:1420 stop:1590 length:171 start_codon:yes stop_codon:yes gene_type:complete
VFCLRVDIYGVITDITPQTFRHHTFAGAKVISGEKYYIDKAVGLGAIRAKTKKKKD